MASKIKEIQVIDIQPRWMQKREVMKYLGISEHFFNKLLADGHILAHPSTSQAGRHVVWYDKEQIDSYIKGLMVQ